MANVKGEGVFDALGKKWTIKLDIDQLIEAETLTGKTVMEMGQNPGLGLMRALLVVGLQPAHPEVDTVKASEIIKDLGLIRVAEVVGDAMRAAFPKQTQGAGLAAANPPRPKAKSRRRK